MELKAEADGSHRPLCRLELIARDHAERCPGEACPYWENGCVLARVEGELDHRSDVVEFLLAVRRGLEQPDRVTEDAARAHFRRRLSAGRE